MSAHCSSPRLAAFYLLLVLGFASATSFAQVNDPYFVSPNRAPVMPRVSLGEPLMTPQLMAMLIDATRQSPGAGVLDKKIAKTFGLGAGTIVMPLELAWADTATDRGQHYFAVPLMSESNEAVIFIRQEDGSIEAYLSDASARLRSAVVLEANGTLRKVSRWKAAGRFMAELDLIGKEARSGVKRYLREN